MNMRYHDPDLTHDESVTDLATGDVSKVTTALISVGLNETDCTWAQSVCLQHMRDDNEDIASAAIVAIGHIARRFGTLDMDKVMPALQQAMRKCPALSGVIGSAMDDIEMFT
ncbi:MULTISPECIES: hypothetical protein [Pseudomonas]|jgi:hypothetical protein|uniref:HEAT repeat domain-containing protein n=2 Tax=Pseudomonas TaxID=286 RepID=A0A4Y9TF94_PSEFL|nr:MULTISPECIES: hypothetical protein [Pseudomonas]CRM98572.1 hypothetical protein [Pseudomonas sp. 22 E 5]MCX9150801.1 hypothetical protein [Pseudomonas sp. TB1-B1]QXH68763.1 hypothetical protein KSS96_07460 [Pseudomonas asgharzadehiana]TFW42751.1 hypothetical protein E4T65_13345 [Pseudomonas fluorescens]TKJ64198.1 hypothetical protein PspCFBP13506_06650 [Pseudomonas sp. CFBP13506]